MRKTPIPEFPSSLRRILTSLDDKKGVNIRLLDVREVLSYTDYLVLCSGTSNTQVAALVNSVRHSGKGEERPVYVNSSKDDSWWVVDFVDVVVHVFREDARLYYDLDGLWCDAVEIFHLDEKRALLDP